MALKRTFGHLLSKFLFAQVVAVPDLFLTAVKLSHEKTGAQYLHAARDDSNNLFRFGAHQCLCELLLSGLPRSPRPLCVLSVQFRTTPLDSTGVPHILEHTVLCGSEKYPCRDPFFKMLNRSLSTFMNAFTGTQTPWRPTAAGFFSSVKII